MAIRLPDELRSAINSQGGAPLHLIDEETQAAYVLLPADEFARLRPAGVQSELDDTYAAQIESAMRGGWADPEMDEYNDYDSHRRPS